ncbi:MAG: hypothetical protein LBD48_05235 [Treponema sp.]|jgi:hypothetical protein|nr:hypothetical protein [Treponema sp.]
MRKAVFGFIVSLIFGSVLAGCETGNTEQTTLKISGIGGSRAQVWIFPDGNGDVLDVPIGGAKPIDIVAQEPIAYSAVTGTAVFPVFHKGSTAPWTGKGANYDMIIGIDVGAVNESWYKLGSKKLDSGTVAVALTVFTPIVIR